MRAALLAILLSSAALPALGQTFANPDLRYLHNDLYALGKVVAGAVAAQPTDGAVTGPKLDALGTKLDALGTKLDTLHADLAKLQAPAATPAPSAPAAPANWELADHVPAAPGATVQLPAGTELVPVALSQPITIQGAGMRQTLLNGRGGVDNGHRLAWGKGFFHLAAGPSTIQDVGFFDDARNGNGTSDGETSAYAEGWPAAGTMTFLRVAFDGQEDGLFSPTPPGAANIAFVVDRSVFGRVLPNGLNDGRSHDIYGGGGSSWTITGSVFVGNSRANTIKLRAPVAAISGNYIGRGNGRWLDLPARTALVSHDNVYVQAADAGSNNAIGVFDEGDTASGGPASSLTSTNDTFCLAGQRSPVVWNNDPAGIVTFVNPVLHWAGAAGGPIPQFQVQGPGAVTGLRALTDADRVDACPAPPPDPQ